MTANGANSRNPLGASSHIEIFFRLGSTTSEAVLYWAEWQSAPLRAPPLGRDACPRKRGDVRSVYMVEGTMPTPAGLREQSRFFRQAITKEAEPHLKRYLASHALALAQLAEKIECEKASSAGQARTRTP